jgi:hypothetical protein
MPAQRGVLDRTVVAWSENSPTVNDTVLVVIVVGFFIAAAMIVRLCDAMTASSVDVDPADLDTPTDPTAST